jgi:hypothetical protein
MAIKIKSKEIDKHIRCTIYGYVYDDRVIKAHWINGTQEGVESMTREHLEEKPKNEIEDKSDFDKMMKVLI